MSTVVYAEDSKDAEDYEVIATLTEQLAENVILEKELSVNNPNNRNGYITVRVTNTFFVSGEVKLQIEGRGMFLPDVSTNTCEIYDSSYDILVDSNPPYNFIGTPTITEKLNRGSSSNRYSQVDITYSVNGNYFVPGFTGSHTMWVRCYVNGNTSSSGNDSFGRMSNLSICENVYTINGVTICFG